MPRQLETEEFVAGGEIWWRHLTDLIVEVALTCGHWDHALHVLECDHDEGGAYSPLAGLRAAASLILATTSSGKPAPPVLVVGIPAFDEFSDTRYVAIQAELTTLRQCTGAAYLRYGFTRQHLHETVMSIFCGMNAAQPALQPQSLEAVLRASSNVRHWLEGRLNNEGAALADYRAAARGGRLHSSYLDPKDSISAQHQDMLDRLYAFEPVLMRFVPGSNGLPSTRQTMLEFAATWKSLEETRAEFRASCIGGDAVLNRGLATRMCDLLEQVAELLRRAIEATRRLDDQVRQVKRST